MTHDKHNPNMELVAQGVANIFSPLFGGLPATGAIARTATNVRAGAKTPVAGMIHALTLLAVILFAAPLVKNVPLAALAGILFMVAYNMGDWGEIPETLKLPKADIAVWALTFGLTVFADLTPAVEVGMILAAFTFIRKISQTTTVSKVTDEYIEHGRVHTLQDKAYSGVCGGLPNSWTVFVWRDGQDFGDYGKYGAAAGDCDCAFAEYDSDRCHGDCRAAGVGGPVAQERAVDADLRGAATAGGVDEGSGV